MHPDLHGSDEAKQDAQLKRIERRAKKATRQNRLANVR
jgi:hypothetical protein